MTKKEMKTYPIIEPKFTPKENFFVSKKFRESIEIHIIKNYYLHDRNPPLFLTIQGPKGEGKSSQTIEICSQFGAFVIPISGATISGIHEGDPLEELKNIYTYASCILDIEKKFVVILIDDFDLSVASVFKNREYTVNTQLINGFLMNLADDPTKCGNKSTRRIPMIFTGNNFTGLYKPLVRPGRMDFFDWKPTLDQKIQIVSAIYSKSLQSDKSSTVTTIQNKFIQMIGTNQSYRKNNIIQNVNRKNIIQKFNLNPGHQNLKQQMQGPESETQNETMLVANDSTNLANQNPIRLLVEEFADQPIAFFESLKSDLIDEIILTTIENDGGQINKNSIRQAVIETFEMIPVNNLLEFARKRELMYAKDF